MGVLGTFSFESYHPPGQCGLGDADVASHPPKPQAVGVDDDGLYLLALVDQGMI